jgi:hypothetical protein
MSDLLRNMKTLYQNVSGRLIFLISYNSFNNIYSLFSKFIEVG